MLRALGIFSFYIFSLYANAQMFIDADSTYKSVDKKESDRREWYSFDSKKMAKHTVGNCVSTPGAASELLPSNDWIVRLDYGVGKECVSWVARDYQWYEILRSIDEQNEHISIWINNREKVVGWSLKPESAFHIAKREPTIWHMLPSKSVWDNFDSWLRSIEWQLVWSAKGDFPVKAHSYHFGHLVGTEGVIEEIIKKINGEIRTGKFGVRFDQHNKVVEITTLSMELNNVE